MDHCLSFPSSARPSPCISTCAAPDVAAPNAYAVPHSTSPTTCYHANRDDLQSTSPTHKRYTSVSPLDNHTLPQTARCDAVRLRRDDLRSTLAAHNVAQKVTLCLMAALADLHCRLSAPEKGRKEKDVLQSHYSYPGISWGLYCSRWPWIAIMHVLIGTASSPLLRFDAHVAPSRASC